RGDTFVQPPSTLCSGDTQGVGHIHPPANAHQRSKLALPDRGLQCATQQGWLWLILIIQEHAVNIKIQRSHHSSYPAEQASPSKGNSATAQTQRNSSATIPMHYQPPTIHDPPSIAVPRTKVKS